MAVDSCSSRARGREVDPGSGRTFTRPRMRSPRWNRIDRARRDSKRLERAGRGHSDRRVTPAERGVSSTNLQAAGFSAAPLSCESRPLVSSGTLPPEVEADDAMEPIPGTGVDQPCRARVPHRQIHGRSSAPAFAPAGRRGEAPLSAIERFKRGFRMVKLRDVRTGRWRDCPGCSGFRELAVSSAELGSSSSDRIPPWNAGGLGLESSDVRGGLPWRGVRLPCMRVTRSRRSPMEEELPP